MIQVATQVFNSIPVKPLAGFPVLHLSVPVSSDAIPDNCVREQHGDNGYMPTNMLLVCDRLTCVQLPQANEQSVLVWQRNGGCKHPISSTCVYLHCWVGEGRGEG